MSYRTISHLILEFYHLSQDVSQAFLDCFYCLKLKLPFLFGQL